MTVKIIKKGETKRDKYFIGTCYAKAGGCGTEIACTGVDLKIYKVDKDNIDPREHDYDYVICPVCGLPIVGLVEDKEGIYGRY